MVLAALIISMPLLRGRAKAIDPGVSDMVVYRDQLRELETDVERGVLSPSEAETSRIEISRRLLAADARERAALATSPKSPSRIAVAALCCSVVLGSLGLYSVIGAPGMPDQPLAERIKRIPQEEAERQLAESVNLPRVLGAQETELLERLQTILSDRPDDLKGHQLLASTLDSIGDHAGAWRAQESVVRILGEDATADDISRQAELMILAAGGYVAPEADQVLARALQTNPSDQRARYYSGMSLAQNGKPDLAMRLWNGLLSEGAPDAAWKDSVIAQMRQLSESTGAPLPQTALRGPTQEDIEAASEMSEDDRTAMIRSMVEGLSDRLATEGGSSAEWARLIRALGVLGETEQAGDIYSEAQETFASDTDALAEIKSAAESVGLK